MSAPVASIPLCGFATPPPPMTDLPPPMLTTHAASVTSVMSVASVTRPYELQAPMAPAAPVSVMSVTRPTQIPAPGISTLLTAASSLPSDQPASYHPAQPAPEPPTAAEARPLSLFFRALDDRKWAAARGWLKIMEAAPGDYAIAAGAQEDPEHLDTVLLQPMPTDLFRGALRAAVSKPWAFVRPDPATLAPHSGRCFELAHTVGGLWAELKIKDPVPHLFAIVDRLRELCPETHEQVLWRELLTRDGRWSEVAGRLWVCGEQQLVRRLAAKAGGLRANTDAFRAAVLEDLGKLMGGTAAAGEVELRAETAFLEAERSGVLDRAGEADPGAEVPAVGIEFRMRSRAGAAQFVSGAAAEICCSVPAVSTERAREALRESGRPWWRDQPEPQSGTLQISRQASVDFSAAAAAAASARRPVWIAAYAMDTFPGTDFINNPPDHVRRSEGWCRIKAYKELTQQSATLPAPCIRPKRYVPGAPKVRAVPAASNHGASPAAGTRKRSRAAAAGPTSLAEMEAMLDDAELALIRQERADMMVGRWFPTRAGGDAEVERFDESDVFAFPATVNKDE